MDDPVDNKPPTFLQMLHSVVAAAFGVQSYTSRKGQELSVTERWLAPNLGYDN